MMGAAFGSQFVAPFNGIDIPSTAATKFVKPVPEVSEVPEAQTPKVRSKFPETWIWDNVDVDG